LDEQARRYNRASLLKNLLKNSLCLIHLRNRLKQPKIGKICVNQIELNTKNALIKKLKQSIHRWHEKRRAGL